MPAAPADSPRARYHDHVRTEIETVAWRQVSEADVDALSIKAIAGEMGVSAAALYRYIGSRDELLDTLAERAANELVLLLDGIATSIPDCTDRVVAIAGCVRRWATEYPGRFALVFRPRDGRPRIPCGVVAAERRVLELITSACSGTRVVEESDTPSGRPRPRPARHVPPARTSAPTPSPERGTSDRALSIWTRIVGTVELELTGHLAELGVDVDDYFETEIRIAMGTARPVRMLQVVASSDG